MSSTEIRYQVKDFNSTMNDFVVLSSIYHSYAFYIEDKKIYNHNPIGGEYNCVLDNIQHNKNGTILQRGYIELIPSSSNEVFEIGDKLNSGLYMAVENKGYALILGKIGKNYITYVDYIDGIKC